MDPESALIAGIAAEPYGCGWLVLADHYEELQDPRHELLRLVYDARYRPELSLPERSERIGELRAAGVQYPWLRFTNSVGIEFAWVPPGHSWLGGGRRLVRPRSRAKKQMLNIRGHQEFMLPNGVWCGVYPVTQGEWQAVMGNNPSHFQGNPRLPVDNVNWDQITNEFLPRLNAKCRGDGYGYRLPTAEEWEYTCRGGPISQAQSAYDYYSAQSTTDLTHAPTNDLSTQQANFDSLYPDTSTESGLVARCTTEVGLYLPNPLGIYDMHGNLWEWTATLKGSFRVLQGGSWANTARQCSATSFLGNLPNEGNYLMGFRILAVPSEQ